MNREKKVLLINVSINFDRSEWSFVMFLFNVLRERMLYDSIIRKCDKIYGL